MKLSALLIMIFLLMISCREDDVATKELTFENFNKYLTEDMDYNTLIKTFGEPSRDVGSGIHIYIYELVDSTEISIGFTDYILSARHYDKDQNLLHVIIE